MDNVQRGRLGRFVSTFTDMARLPRALWIVTGAFVAEAMAYFGILTLMSSYISTDLRWGDEHAGLVVSLFTMTVTLLMLGVGSLAEGYGLRRAIVAALLIGTLGRLVYAYAEFLHGEYVIFAVVGGLLVVATGSAILQPVCYSGVKQYTDEKTSSMGYAMIYAFMNLGIVGVGAMSAWIRPAVQDIKDGHSAGAPGAVVRWLSEISASGIQAVNWACAGVTAVSLLLFMLLMTKRAEAAKLRPDTVELTAGAVRPPLRTRVKLYFTEGPFSNKRFLFFIFMLLPVRTLFAHQWLTFPEYILRAYDKGVADRMEWLVNWINPAIIFIGVPLSSALTRKINVYKMMMAGSLVSAVPTFLLCAGPSLGRLITYFVLFSIGEAMWSARFLEYASELAPPGRVSQFMGLANVPWLLAKATTGFYSGYMLATYCPANLPRAELHTGTMWFVYGCIAMLSPIGLFLGRKWVMKGLHTVSEKAA